MKNIIKLFDNRLEQIITEVKQSDYWKFFTSDENTREEKLGIMKHIMREIWTYQKEVNRAVFTAVGRHGTKVEEQGLMRAMIAVQIEEVGHGTLALNDFYKLGGTVNDAEKLPCPASLAMISVVRFLADNYHPLCHLGYMYFFEQFTVLITDIVSPVLKDIGYPGESLEFMRLHALEDERHADMLSRVINETVEEYDDAYEHILYGFDCFSEVYPHAIWRTAVKEVQTLQTKELTYG